METSKSVTGIKLLNELEAKLEELGVTRGVQPYINHADMLYDKYADNDGPAVDERQWNNPVHSIASDIEWAVRDAIGKLNGDKPFEERFWEGLLISPGGNDLYTANYEFNCRTLKLPTEDVENIRKRIHGLKLEDLPLL